MSSRSGAHELADISTPLLRNVWYVAGYADEFDVGLHERIFLDRSIVIFKNSDGTLSALQNRCAHRSFPLANGSKEGDAIRCRYHGAKYDRDGKLIEFPSAKRCPNISLRSYPIRISGPLAWIWMGDDPNPDISEIPDTPWLGEGWAYATGNFVLEGNWLLMAENLMDLTHIPFLHQSSLKFSKGYAEAKITLRVEKDRLSFCRVNPPGYHRTGFMNEALSDRLEKAGFEATSTVEFVSPALSFGRGEFFAKNWKDNGLEQEAHFWRVAHFVTPMSQDRTHYWFFHSRNYDVEDSGLTEKIRDLTRNAFEEDRFAIEHIQKMHDRDATDFREAHFKSDAPGVSMRRIIASLAAEEGAAASGSPS